MADMQLTQIWQYPVKSMVGVTTDTAALAPTGLVGDRLWALRDSVTGGIANTRQTPGIMRLAATHADGGHVAISTPEGRTILSSDPGANDVLSEVLGRGVSLESLRPADDLEFYRRQGEAPADFMGYLREIFARDEDEPLPDFAKFGPYVAEFESPPGTFYDCFPLMVMSTSALRSMQEALPESIVDVRRFRPSLVIDTGDAEGHPEFAWAGLRFTLGSAVVEVVNDCPRCAAITKEINDDIPQDRAILRHVVRDLGQAVGVYCNVVQPGIVTLGDELVPLPT
jgi:uncharacterized protein YcbX